MDDLNCATYTDESGNVLAQACASGNPMFSFNPNFENTYFSDSAIDKPWYQDTLDWLSGPAMVNGAPMTAWQVLVLMIVGGACAVLMSLLLSRLMDRPQSTDLNQDGHPSDPGYDPFADRDTFPV